MREFFGHEQEACKLGASFELAPIAAASSLGSSHCSATAGPSFWQIKAHVTARRHTAYFRSKSGLRAQACAPTPDAVAIVESERTPMR